MEIREIDWKPIPRAQFYAWMIFYGVLVVYLARHLRQLTLLDDAHLPIHEAGHLLFSARGKNGNRRLRAGTAKWRSGAGKSATGKVGTP